MTSHDPARRGAAEPAPPSADFGEFVRRRHAAGQLVVQPRMGITDPHRMRAGLYATKHADATTVGTLTLDSFTRVGDLEAVARALREGHDLNGYPIVSYGPELTRGVLDGIVDATFPVQVRHGSARPRDIFTALVASGLHATEGGPVSYCLPYGRTPLDESVRNWTEACEQLLPVRESGLEPHVETFGGCMLGQLCPPSQLVALSVLEAMFFHEQGLRSLSVSYAQQINPEQDREALAALRTLCARLLPGTQWHIVVYAYMGLYPATPHGSLTLLGRAVELAVAGGAARLIVKTVSEAHRIATVAENVQALEHAARVAEAAHAARARATPGAGATAALPATRGGEDNQVYREAYALVDAVLNCGPTVGRSLLTAFKRGLLDVPYCLHPDNAGRARSCIDEDGRLNWAELGGLPLAGVVERRHRPPLTSSGLMQALARVRDHFDALAPEAVEGAWAGSVAGSGTGLPAHRTVKGELG